MNKFEKFILEKERHGLKPVVTSKEKKLLNKNIPFQLILKFIDFGTIKLKVVKDVFIPRYETQEVIEFAKKVIKNNDKVLDLCCGNGIIGLSLKKTKKNISVTMSDISDAAIKLAKKNSKKNKLKVEIIKSNLFEKINKKFNVIVSNPPYISKKTKLDKSVLNFEPTSAIFAKEKGNYFYRKIIKESKKYLEKNGYLIFEISPINKLFLKKMNFTILKDINNKERIAYKKF